MTRAVKSTILTPPPRKKRPESLTSREREILELIWAGFRNKEIGQTRQVEWRRGRALTMRGVQHKGHDEVLRQDVLRLQGLK